MITTPNPAPFVWTRDVFHHLGDLGIFGDQRVELIEGQVFQMSPMNDPHIIGQVFLANELPLIANGRYTVLVQTPLTLNDSSEPAPDGALFRGAPRDYQKSLSKEALLVIELSDSTLAFDRTVKARLYAAANIPEYWIVNLSEQVEILRDPRSESGYATKTVTKKGNRIHPVAAPDLIVEVDRFFA